MSGWLDLLTQAAPTIAGMIGGPLAGSAVGLLEKALGVSGADAVQSVITSGDPQVTLKLHQAELDAQAHMAEIQAEVEKVRIASDASQVAAINATMQEEARTNNYGWRSAIGYSVAALLIATGITIISSYWGVMFFSRDASILTTLAGLIGAVSALLITPVGILGVDLHHRGMTLRDKDNNAVNQ